MRRINGDMSPLASSSCLQMFAGPDVELSSDVIRGVMLSGNSVDIRCDSCFMLFMLRLRLSVTSMFLPVKD